MAEKFKSAEGVWQKGKPYYLFAAAKIQFLTILGNT
jgi:hypothetical protein